jgi:hypothetical protein
MQDASVLLLHDVAGLLRIGVEPALRLGAPSLLPRETLDGLLARGDVVVVGGIGSSRSPREFMTVEDFAALSGKRPRTTAEAKTIAAAVINSELFAPTIPLVVQSARSRRAARR